MVVKGEFLQQVRGLARRQPLRRFQSSVRRVRGFVSDFFYHLFL
jgi:hypothetical protein